jgi:hypothetical protein
VTGPATGPVDDASPPADAIPPERFAYWLTLFCERWNRPRPSDPFLAEFYRAANAALTPAEWEVAAALTWQHATFWPSVGDVIDRVTGLGNPNTVRSLAVDTYHQLDRPPVKGWNVVTGGTWNRAAIEREHGSAALRAFDLAGGEAAWRERTDATEHWVRDKFVKAFTDEAAAIERAHVVHERLTAVAGGTGRAALIDRKQKPEAIGAAVRRYLTAADPMNITSRAVDGDGPARHEHG